MRTCVLAIFLQSGEREIREWFFVVSPLTVAAAVATLAVGLAVVALLWWIAGRDRIYTRDYPYGNDFDERIRPLRHRPVVVVEYTPPEALRPAEMGLLLNERIGTREITGTLADLAARGYIEIAEDHIITGEPAWIVRLADDTAETAAWERELIAGLMDGRDIAVLAELTPSYFWAIGKMRRMLDRRAAEMRWFAGEPESARRRWITVGAAVAAFGAFLAFVLGSAFHLGLVGVAVIITGGFIAWLNPVMPRRTAYGRELLRRVAGFRRFVEEAGASRHAFDEREAMFTEHLGYAIVFGSANRWADTFRKVSSPDALHMIVRRPPPNHWSEALLESSFQIGSISPGSQSQ